MPVSEEQWHSEPTQAPAIDRARLVAINTEIEKLKMALNALYSERKLIQDRLDSYTYPVLTLPNEIVSEIFVQYLPPYPTCPALLGDGSPTKLAQICSHWRQIAHGTPALWRAIELFVSRPFSDVAELQLETMQSWLERSYTLPLSVIMGAEAHYNLRGTALSHLLTRRARWEHVMLSLPSDNADQECLEGSMPLLLQLDVQYNIRSRVDTLFGSLHVPRLHTVFLDIYHLPVGYWPPNLPWGQLTKLYLSNTYIQAALAIMHEAINLVHWKLQLNDRNGTRGSDSRLLHLPRLETLMIVESAAESDLVVEFLHTVRAPDLKCFCIQEDLLRQPTSSVPSVLAAVIKSFECHRLERLSIAETQSPADYQAAFPGIYCDYIREEWGQWDLLELCHPGA
ncbi:hypothetical protein C8F01DRAFT_1043069 [Mycena amicta]|nr:hypothetical protein C8F01DRAFT_1043069 [Mycena amicta]